METYRRIDRNDLGWDFFIGKFDQQENRQKALKEGPSFVMEVFLR